MHVGTYHCSRHSISSLEERISGNKEGRLERKRKDQSGEGNARKAKCGRQDNGHPKMPVSQSLEPVNTLPRVGKGTKVQLRDAKITLDYLSEYNVIT